MPKIPIYICKKGWADGLARKLAHRPNYTIVEKRPLELMREEKSGKTRYKNCILLIKNASRLLHPDYTEPEYALLLLKETLRKIGTQPIIIILEVDGFNLTFDGKNYKVIISNTCKAPIGIVDWIGTQELQNYYNISNECCVKTLLI